VPQHPEAAAISLVQDGEQLAVSEARVPQVHGLQPVHCGCQHWRRFQDTCNLLVTFISHMSQPVAGQVQVPKPQVVSISGVSLVRLGSPDSTMIAQRTEACCWGSLVPARWARSTLGWVGGAWHLQRSWASRRGPTEASPEVCQVVATSLEPGGSRR